MWCVMKNKKKSNKRIKDLEKQYRATISKRLIIGSVFGFIILILLLARIAWIEFINGPTYKQWAYNQQTINKIVSPKRGTIYDSTGQTLATSASVDTVSINPTLISAERKEIIAKALSEIFELDYDSVFEKVNSNSQFKTIIQKVEQDKISKLKEWMSTNKISRGINIDSDSKRYYPYNNLASSLIGFCNSENSGAYGLEYKWNDVLTGTPGKIVTSKNGKAQEIPDENQTYIAAENGSDIVLTIDFNLQSIAEKYLKQAVIENQCTKGGNVIMMNPSTGDIYAMATYPDFDLNSPSIPIETSVRNNWDSYSSEERNSILANLWKNRAVSDSYEPGSTFKIIMAAIALEEGITSTDVPGDFYCSGIQTVYDTDIKCWKYYNPHYSQTLRQAIQNSCNPAFIQLGQRIGPRTLFKYFKAFGLLDKTGAAVASEGQSIFFNEETINPVELATMSFGQRITVTPLQLITAVSAIANDGVLMQPRIVKQIINSDTGVTTNIDPVTVRQVVSKETADSMKDLLQSVVVDGTGKWAAVNGYSVGGKSGTSEPVSSKSEEGYTASFLAISPVENTQLVVLVTLYDPTNKEIGHQGGRVAGPVVSQILTEALPYLGIPSNSTSTNDNSSDSTITLPDVRTLTVAKAEEKLKSLGFKVKSTLDGDKNEITVIDQVPKGGSKLTKDSIICLYTSEENERPQVTIPNLKGLTASQATNSLRSKNLNISIDGSGKVISQSPSYDNNVEEGTIINVILREDLIDAH